MNENRLGDGGQNYTERSRIAQFANRHIREGVSPVEPSQIELVRLRDEYGEMLSIWNTVGPGAVVVILNLHHQPARGSEFDMPLFLGHPLLQVGTLAYAVRISANGRSVEKEPARDPELALDELIVKLRLEAVLPWLHPEESLDLSHHCSARVLLGGFTIALDFLVQKYASVLDVNEQKIRDHYCYYARVYTLIEAFTLSM